MASVSKIIVRIWSAILAVIFLAISILGIIAIVMIKQYRGIGAGILVFGLVGLGVAIAGLAGAGFEKNAGEENTSGTKIKGILLVLFFAIMCILHVLIMIFGVSLICVRSSVKMLITLPNEEWKKLYSTLPESFRTSPSNAITKMQNFAVGVGIVIIVMSVIILITCFAAAVQMGKKLFTQFFMAAFSIVEIIIGFALAIFLLILFANHKNVFFAKEVQTNIIVPVVVFGFVLALVGFIGFAAIFIGHRYKIISVVFSVANVIVLVAFVALFILCIVFNHKIIGLSSTICPSTTDGVYACQETLDKANQNLCSENPVCYTDSILKVDVRKMMQGFVTILMFVCLYLVLFLLVVVISTCLNCFRPVENDDSKESAPLYAYMY